MQMTLESWIGLALFVLPFVVLMVVVNRGHGTQGNVIHRYVG